MKPSLAAIACAAVVALVFQDPATSAPPRQIETVRLLDVPYVPQGESLCGGAALAMVLRYWGEPAVLAEDFAMLLEPGAPGIPTDVLVSAVRSRGWTALPVTGDSAVIRSHLAGGRPTIALSGQSSGSFHYVVIVAWANGSVIIHDPAVGPYQVIREVDFNAGWDRTGRWSLLVLPPVPTSEHGDRDSMAVSTASVITQDGCDAMVDEGIDRALAGDSMGAEVKFMAAAALCPESAAPWRELAGLRFNLDDWAGATRLAERALELDPGDPDTWRLLAGSRFLGGDIEGALGAWNRVSEPRMDLAHIDGLVRMRYRAVTDQIDLPPRRIITPGAFRRARRRLAELPAQSSSRLSVKPLAGGAAQVNVAVLERPLLFDGPWDAGGRALHSIVNREISVDLASPSGRGELWTAQYRWWRERPRLLLALSIPAPGGRPGIWRVEGSWERQAYAIRESVRGEPSNAAGLIRKTPGLIREERRRTSLSFSDWIAPDLRLEAGAALDKWVDRGSFVSIGAALEARAAGDRLVMTVGLAGWTCPTGAAPFQTGSLDVQWQPNEFSRAGWRARIGLQGASSNAPLALWPGAGTGHARPPLLRAHPLLHEGILDGPVFGRTLIHGGLERQEWPWTLGPMRLGLAAFVDGAGAGESLGKGGAPRQLDGGIGLRLAGIGRRGQFRLDVARGFLDGESAVSIAWESR